MHIVGLMITPLYTHTITPAFPGKKPLTSPKTNLEIGEAGALLFPNVALRSLISEYTAAKKREWAAAERRWREWAEGQEQGQQG